MKYLLALLLISQVLYSKPKLPITTPRFSMPKSSPYFKRFTPSKSVSIQSGVSGYFGEIAPFTVYGTTSIEALRANLGVEFAHNFKKNLSYRINLNYIQISSDDKYYDSRSSYAANFNRGTKFTANMIELTSGFQYDLPINKVTPYVLIGLGGFVYNKPENNETGVNLAIPFGAGIKTKLNKHFDLGAELNYRYTFTDKLDGITDDESYKLFSSASIMKGPDLFYTIQLKLTYHFLANTSCPR